MERRSVSPASRPRNLSFQRADTMSASPSPASECETKRWTDDLEEYDEVSEYIKEVDEILDFFKPFPRTVEQEPQEKEPLKPGLDHLENLIRLVEHLKDLKERNAQSRQKTQYLKDLKTLRDKKRKEREEEPLPPPVEPPWRPLSSITFRKGNRSKSLCSNEYERLLSNDVFFPPRTSLAPIKAKVSKWTKVKEAFRWEKAATLDTRLKHSKSDKKSDLTRTSDSVGETLAISSNRLQVPGDSKHGDPPSPADSVLSGQISSGTSTSCLLVSSGYSGEHSSAAHSASSVHLLDLGSPSTDLLRSVDQEDSLSYSSSDDEKLDEAASIPKNVSEDSVTKYELQEDIESRRSKSLDGGTILGPTKNFLHHLSKESLQESCKMQKPHHKTPWGKVKDIIHTGKGSLKKKTRKREDFIAEAEAFSAGLDLPLPDELSGKQPKPFLEITPCEGIPTSPLYPSVHKLEHSMMRPFTPVLTLTLPSSEELQKIATIENLESKSGWLLGSPEDEACKMSEFLEERGKLQGRSSRWGKVKRAFLTSGPGHEDPSSAPSSPLHLGSFFSDIESDELSSGEWMDHEKRIDIQSMTAAMKAEVQRNYSELQHKLCQELDASVAECEMLKDLTVKPDDKPRSDDGDKIAKRPRESLTIPMPTVDDLSPEFKKKLDEWKKIKKTPPTPTSAKEEVQSHFMTRIGEWQRWRPGSHKVDLPVPYKQEHHLHDDFYKKLEEWQMLKSTKRRSRSHSDRGKEEETPSPGLSRKNSKGAIKKLTSGSGKSSGAESLSGSLKEKEGRAGRKSHREKDLQWLEKELHKIEREKIRLEREREKYLEREARLEQMKRSMGTPPTQEVLIQTATGFFRFEGISQKFTKKLYEWEKARGIAPEASTIALLEAASVAKERPARDERIGLQRSKSVGSVIDTGSIVAQSIAHHPSSLSLNDVDDLEALEQATILDGSQASSEPGMDFKEEDEPEAIIVDVEDVVEETAAPLSELQILTHIPVYSYAPAEVTQLIDSSGSDGEHDVQVLEVKAITPRNTEEKVMLIDHNINLLERLEVKEAICREIENDLENYGEGASGQPLSTSSQDNETTPHEEENLKHSFLEHSEQQEELARDLVDKMHLLHAASASGGSDSNVKQVLDLSTQLLGLAQKLERVLSKRNADIKNLRSNIHRRRMKVKKMGSGKAWYSIDEGCTSDVDANDCWPTGSEDDIDELPSLITKKVLELKEGLNSLKDVSEADGGKEDYSHAVPESEHSTASFTVQVARTEAMHSRSSISELESPRPRKAKRPSLKILTSESPISPENLSPVTVTLSPPLWKNTQERVDEPKERRLEKSRHQHFFSESAKETFETNLKLSNIEKEKKSPEVIKKKIKEKISEMQRLALETRIRFQPAEDVGSCNMLLEEEKNNDRDIKVVVVKKNDAMGKSKKLLKTRRITDTVVFSEKEAKKSVEFDDDDVFIQDEYQYDHNKTSTGDILTSSAKNTETPSFVFVPTARKIISPVERDRTSSVLSYVIDDIESQEGKESDISDKVDTNKAIKSQEGHKEPNQKCNLKLKMEQTPTSSPSERKNSVGMSPEVKRSIDIGIPPLPNSPNSARKLMPSKESSPSIRMMIAKYNQKITEQHETDTGGSSPVGWRSPVLERRIKEQMDKFQKDGTNALKYGGKFERREVQKSASAGLLRGQDTSEKTITTVVKLEQGLDNDQNRRGILKSSSTGTIKSTPLPSPAAVSCGSQEKEKAEVLKFEFPPPEPRESTGSLASRAQKIKQAKAEFLSRGPCAQSWNDGSLDMTPTPSLVSEPFSWGATAEATGAIPKDLTTLRNRYSHVSMGSESSYEETSCADELTRNLTKSVSAGMINLERWEMFRRKSEGNAEKMCTKQIVGHSAIETNLQTSKSSSRFGISNIKSRFRKAKMRKTKEKESAVSTLCRQSLLLDVCQHPAAEGARTQSTTSKSCPSSPVMNRSKGKSDDARKWISGKLFKNKDNKQASDAISLNKRPP